MAKNLCFPTNDTDLKEGFYRYRNLKFPPGGSILFELEPMPKSTKWVGGYKWKISKSTLVLFEPFLWWIAKILGKNCQFLVKLSKFWEISSIFCKIVVIFWKIAENSTINCNFLFVGPSAWASRGYGIVIQRKTELSCDLPVKLHFAV